MDDVDPLEYAESTVSPQKGIQVLLKQLCIICALYIIIVDFTLKLKHTCGSYSKVSVKVAL